MGLFGLGKSVKVNLQDNPIMEEVLALAKSGKMKCYYFTDSMIYYNFRFKTLDRGREIHIIGNEGVMIDFKQRGYQTMPSKVYLKFVDQLVKEIKKLPNVCDVEQHVCLFADEGSRLYNPRWSNSSQSLGGWCVIVTYKDSTIQDTSGKAWV